MAPWGHEGLSRIISDNLYFIHFLADHLASITGIIYIFLRSISRIVDDFSHIYWKYMDP